MTVFGIFQSNHSGPAQQVFLFQSKLKNAIIYHFTRILFWSAASSYRNSILKSISILSSELKSSMFNKMLGNYVTRETNWLCSDDKLD